MDSSLAALVGNGKLKVLGNLLGFMGDESGMVGTEEFGRSLGEQSQPTLEVFPLK